MSPELELDLDEGDADAAERITRTKESKVSGSGGSRSNRSRGGSKSSSSKSGSQRSDTDLVSKLSAAFDRIADQLEIRGDDELATALHEDKQKLAQGIVSLTRAIKPFRTPLVILVAIIEPILAFWRVGSILARRAIERRERVMAERAAAQEQAQEQSPDLVGVQ